MDKRKKLHDYTKKREVIENPIFYTKGILQSKKCKASPHALFIYIPDKLRRELRMSKYNHKEFKIIICRKSTLPSAIL